jgi:hypothetical protein
VGRQRRGIATVLGAERDADRDPQRCPAVVPRGARGAGEALRKRAGSASVRLRRGQPPAATTLPGDAVERAQLLRERILDQAQQAGDLGGRLGLSETLDVERLKILEEGLSILKEIFCRTQTDEEGE